MVFGLPCGPWTSMWPSFVTRELPPCGPWPSVWPVKCFRAARCHLCGPWTASVRPVNCNRVTRGVPCGRRVLSTIVCVTPIDPNATSRLAVVTCVPKNLTGSWVTRQPIHTLFTDKN